jgi:septal ring factor EnvC (AmiA/AmiB activator)
MSYYGYLNRYRLGRLRGFAERTRHLEALRLEASEETQRLAMLAARQEDTRRRLAQAQTQRTELLAQLEQTIASREERFAVLRADAERLRALVEQLERQAAILPEADVSQEPIATLRGRLAWPLGAGKLVKRFGRVKGDSGQRWDGVLIAAAEGTEVRAVHHGRVVYADWLRGFGLLIIIEHDDGYMSLYGRNQTLLKEAGEWVASGETIALSGSSGGQRMPGLYFAIRHHGRPLDPERWCGSIKKLGWLPAPGDVQPPPRERRPHSPIKTPENGATVPSPFAARLDIAHHQTELPTL